MKFSIKKSIFCFFAIIAFLLFIGRGIFTSAPEAIIKKLLTEADIRINGDRPSDIIVHNEKLYARVLSQGSLGLGESYMDGWWDCNTLDGFFFKLFRADIQHKIPHNINTMFAYLKSKLINLQSKDRAFQVGQQHYDLGDDLFKAMLDARMIYSCAYWKYANNLDQAQENKLELICKKLQLKPGMKLLDIGCGWGGLALYAAQKHDVNVVGITISKEQAKYAQEITKGYPVEIRLQDYRDLHEQFDRIVSVGMFEHVGYKNYQTFINICHQLLKDDGLFLLHTIGGNKSFTRGDDWLNKYIFTNGMLPSIAQVAKTIEGKFVMEDWHNFGADYDKTLMAWYQNFERNWPQLQPKYGDRFKRMWDYYLLSCAGLFRARHIQLWQIVLSKKGVVGGYVSVR
jgi:cyclopropane-fatty-acyl-phospholipid synthase